MKYQSTFSEKKKKKKKKKKKNKRNIINFLSAEYAQRVVLDLAYHKMDTSKQCRPRSDAAERGV